MITIAVICLIPMTLVAIASGILLSLRYGTNWAIFASTLGLVLGSIVAFIIRANFEPHYEYNEDEVYPAEEWRKLTSLDAPPTGFVYRENEGLFVTTNQAEVKISDILPACLADGHINQYRFLSPPIEITTHPRIQLPIPPEQPLSQITFDIPFQFDPEIDTDILGASSYAIYENGEVWCIERVVQRGMSIGMAAAFAGGLQILWNMTVGFGATFTIVIVIAIGYLEIFVKRRGVGQCFWRDKRGYILNHEYHE